MTLAGMANRLLSIRSSMPPCPGMILPKSLTPMHRLIREANKSPVTPVSAMTNAKPIHSQVFMISGKNNDTK